MRFRGTKAADADQAEGTTQTTSHMALGSHRLGGHLTVWTNLEELWRALGNSQAREGFTFWKDDHESKRNPRGGVSGQQETQPHRSPGRGWSLVRGPAGPTRPAAGELTGIWGCIRSRKSSSGVWAVVPFRTGHMCGDIYQDREPWGQFSQIWYIFLT